MQPVRNVASREGIEYPNVALRTYLDSGPPSGIADYTTIVIIHGYVWHGGNFTKLLPFAHQHHARVVLINRRGYPGSAPFDDAELATLQRLASSEPVTPENSEIMLAFIRDRTKEVYDYLTRFIVRENTPVASGVVLVGWSFGTVWMNAFLANVESFSSREVDLRAYIKRLVYYDGSYVGFGQPPPFVTHPADPTDAYDAWLSGYFLHGDIWSRGASALNFGPALTDPSPTTTRMSSEELAESTYPPAGESGGCDRLLTQACMRLGTYQTLQKQAFYRYKDDSLKHRWNDIGVRIVWCDHTEWEMPWGAYSLRMKLQEAREVDSAVRNVVFVRLRGANHFAHWDMPEKVLGALLSDSEDDANSE